MNLDSIVLILSLTVHFFFTLFLLWSWVFTRERSSFLGNSIYKKKTKATQQRERTHHFMHDSDT